MQTQQTPIQPANTQPKIVHTIDDVRAWVQSQKKMGHCVGFVPTMGALHQGHLSLVELSNQKADVTVASIFVNPAQFAPDEDFGEYPRPLESDTKKLARVGCDLIFCPSVQEMYPEGFSTQIVVDDPIINDMEGASRPGFFGGVGLIVTKLLLQVMPDITVFGEKDYQQLLLIQKLVRDLNIPVHVIGCPLIRDENGLALSSRNAYLSDDQYKIAIQLNRVLFSLCKELRSGSEIKDTLDRGREQILAAGFDSIDYLELRHADSLLGVDQNTLASSQQGMFRLLTTARTGEVRLLDNIPV